MTKCCKVYNSRILMLCDAKMLQSVQFTYTYVRPMSCQNVAKCTIHLYYCCATSCQIVVNVQFLYTNVTPCHANMLQIVQLSYIDVMPSHPKMLQIVQFAYIIALPCQNVANYTIHLYYCCAKSYQHFVNLQFSYIIAMVRHFTMLQTVQF